MRGLGESAFWLILIGFHGTFFLMHLTGLLGMPRRIAVYPNNPEWEWLNLISSIFGIIMSAGFALFAFDMGDAVAVRRGAAGATRGAPPRWTGRCRCPHRPTTLPPCPARANPIPARCCPWRGARSCSRRPRDLRETLALDAGSGRPDHVAVLAKSTMLPLLTSAAIGSFFGAVLAGLYWLAPVGIVLTLIAAWKWGDIMGSTTDHPDVQVAPGLTLPLHWQTRNTLARTGTVALLLADGTLYASLLFGVGFLSVVAPGWPAPASGLSTLPMAGAAALALAAMAVGLFAAHRAEALRDRAAGTTWAGIGLAACLVALMALVALVFGLDDPRRHARDALRAVILGFAVFHGVIAAMLALRSLADARGGRTSWARRGAAPIWQLFQSFWLGTSAVSLTLIAAQEVLS